MTDSSDQLLKTLHGIFLDVDKRAERSSAEVLNATFVDSAPLYDMLATRNNQIIYGRRGTGKTHALRYLQKQVDGATGMPIYADLRNIGSNGSIYGDPSRNLAERAGVLVRDVLQILLDSFYPLAVAAIDNARDPAQITARLDDFAAAISEVKVLGSFEREQTDADSSKNSVEAGGKFSLRPSVIGGDIKAALEKAASSTLRTKESGTEVLHINFGRVATALSGLLQVLGGQRVWLLLDEWSEVPLELQPYLADLVRRTILPERLITVKIAAIEHRSRFAIRKTQGEYVGMELGADLAADLNLDDFLVFDSDQAKALGFFKQLLFKHVKASEIDTTSVTSADNLVQRLFTQVPVYEEFVRAVEGVPRDALNLMTKIVGRAWGQKISMQDVRRAARDWYSQDKARDVNDNPELGEFLNHVIDEVIGTRKAKAFLVRSNTRIDEINQLFDSRILHVLKKNISSHDQPGVRYDVYKIDYGCYVELINTAGAPAGLFQDDTGYVEVPRDDYRSIRRAILDVERYRASVEKADQCQSSD